MKRFGRVVEIRGVRLLRAAGLLAITTALAFSLAQGAATHTQSQGVATYPPGYEFDVATIKPNRSTDNGGTAGFEGGNGYRSRNFTLRSVIRLAYGMWGGGDDRLLGGPSWLDTERYDITAKMDATVADKLKKLSPDQRTEIQNEMLQALLAERLKLTVHRETKEFPVYALTITKNGVKLHEAKLGDPYTNAFKYAHNFAEGAELSGKIFLVGGGGPEGHTLTIYGFGVSIRALVSELTLFSGKTVLDRTGQTGNYDFALEFSNSPMRPASESATEGQPVPAAPNPNGSPSLFAAVQQQLGLKLESTRGPVEIIVIDHVERPSGN